MEYSIGGKAKHALVKRRIHLETLPVETLPGAKPSRLLLGRSCEIGRVTRWFVEPHRLGRQTNMANATCGPTDETHWEKIDWSELNSNVKRLQARIVKVVKPGSERGLHKA